MKDSFKNLSLSDKCYNPGTLLTEKNNSNEYILIGYDYTGNNLVCMLSQNNSISNNNISNDNFHIINKTNIDKIIKENILYTQPRFLFE